MQKIGMSLLALFLISGVLAQDTEHNTLHHIAVSKDSRIDSLVKKNREINEEVYFKTVRNMQGFRLQVINTNDRNKALSVKTRLLSDFPEEKTYFIYHSPYFKIQMGNFRTREDAEQLMQKVKTIYPSGVFIVPSKIEIKPSRDGELIPEALGGNP